MKMAKLKWDDIHKEALNSAVGSPAPEDQFVALRAELEKTNKNINKLARTGKKEAKEEKKKRKKDKCEKDGKTKWIPFPKELQNKAAPSDPSKALVIDGTSYWYCPTHKKWGKHSPDTCQGKGFKPGKEKSDKSSDKSSDDGKRNGRAVRALAAVKATVPG